MCTCAFESAIIGYVKQRLNAICLSFRWQSQIAYTLNGQPKKCHGTLHKRLHKVIDKMTPYVAIFNSRIHNEEDWRSIKFIHDTWQYFLKVELSSTFILKKNDYTTQLREKEQDMEPDQGQEQDFTQE